MSYTNGLDKPDLYFNTKLYTGNGSTQSINGIGFQPDLVWVKDRDTSGYNHVANDNVRGVTKYLRPNLTNAEATITDAITSFDSDGFTLGNDSSNGEHNRSSINYVSWNWLGANGTASNTDGSITSTVSANTTSGFSIVSWTGTGDGTPASSGTLGHGLSSAPKMIIVKNRTDGTNWAVYHAGNTSAPETEIIYLNLTNATADDNNFWNDTAPTSSVFTVAGDNGVNGSGDNMIAYCFAEKKGFSKFGSYVGNGSTTANSGTFVYTGFKPSLIIVKNSSSIEGWQMWDNKRSSYNGEGSNLSPNSNNAESTGVRVHLFSNGFQLVSAGADQNSSGETFIYMCFAESPFTTSTGIPTTAR